MRGCWFFTVERPHKGERLRTFKRRVKMQYVGLSFVRDFHDRWAGGVWVRN